MKRDKGNVVVLFILFLAWLSFSSNKMVLVEKEMSDRDSYSSYSTSMAADTQEIFLYNNLSDGVLQDTSICINNTAKIVCVGDPAFIYEWIDDETGDVVEKGRELNISPTSTKTFTLNIYYSTGELIDNCDFSAGYKNFDSDYKIPKRINRRCLRPEGYYVVGNNPSKYHSNFRNMGDHTSGKGKMMIINGAPNPGVKVWGQWIDVKPNTEYAFSTWAVSVCGGAPAELRFTIDGHLLGEQFHLMDHLSGAPAQWAQFYALWNSGSKTRVYISLENMNIIRSGNDFAIDDISFASMSKYSRKVTVNVSPIIDKSELRDTVICEGGDFNVKVSATGSDLNYSWYLNDISIGNDSPELNIPDVNVSHAGTYRCDVESVHGSESVSFNMTVLERTQASLVGDTAVCEGDDLLLNVSASGQDLRYSWYHNEILIGNDSSQLSLNDIDLSHVGKYRCDVDGTCGSKSVSFDLLLKENTTAGIVGDTSVCEGGSIDLTVEASGTGLSYEWRFGSTILCDTTNVLKIEHAHPSFEGEYSCVVSGDCGDTTLMVNLAVDGLTKIVNVSNDSVVCAGDTISLGVTAEGDDLKYSWYHNDIFIGNDSLELNIINAALSHAGNYRCDVEGACGSKSVNFNVNVHDTLHVEVLRDTVICEGEDFNVKVSATGEDLKYTWYQNGISIGNDSPELNIPDVNVSHAGTYRCDVESVCGSESVSFNMTVLERTQASLVGDTAVCEGDDLLLNVSASGQDLRYSWYHNDILIGNDSSQLSLNDIDLSHVGKYRCDVDGTCGSKSVSFDLLLKENTKASIIGDTSVCEGGSIDLTVEASGTGLSYEWRFGSTILCDTTNVLKIEHAHPSFEGEYSCVVSGDCGDTTVMMNLTVLSPPVAYTDFDKLILAVGDNVDILVTSTGGDNDYLWKFKSDTLSSKTGLYSILNADMEDEGVYTCVVSNICGEDSKDIFVNIVNKTVILNNTADTSICENESVLFAVEAEGDNLIYKWYHRDVLLGVDSHELNIVNADTSRSGDYKCIVTGDGGNDTCYISLMVHELPQASIKGLNDVCHNGNYAFNAVDVSQSVDYAWSVVGGNIVGGMDQDSCIVNMTNVGDVKVSLVVVSKTTGCSNKTESDVHVNSLPDVNLDLRDTVGYCETVIPLNGGSPAGGRYIVDGKYSDTLFYISSIKEHEVVYELTDKNTSCFNRDTARVIRAENPYVVLEDSVKIGSCVKYRINAKASKGDYEWNNNGYLDDLTILDPVFTPGMTSMCALKVTDVYGCMAKDSIKIIVAAPPKVKTMADTVIGICNELSLDCTVETDGDYDLLWSPDRYLSDSHSNHVELIDKEEGLRSFTVTVTDDYGCVDEDTVRVQIVGAPELGEDKYCCCGDTMTINLDEYNEVSWSDDYEGKYRKIYEEGEYYVKASDDYGCVDSLMAKVIPLPKVELHDTLIHEGESIDLVPVIDDEEGISYITWQDGSTTYYYNASRQGVYSVEVENIYGCKAKNSMYLTVKDIYMAAPNAFNPRSSGENNKFWLKSKDFKGNFEMVIYNRWGTEMYRTRERGYGGGWNGVYNGLVCQPGAYIWVAYVNNNVWGKGYVMIVK